MSDKNLVSILIVTYNPGEYLRNTLKSCIEQTYDNTEILIFDNASHQDISIYFPKDPEQKIKLIKNSENIGPYNWLNILLGEAKWGYIAIQDHDDIWHPGKIEKQVQFLEVHKEYVGCGTKTIMYYEADRKYFEYFLGKENYYTIHPSLLFRNNGTFRYNTKETEYMCDAYSLKNNLCNGEKKIYNLDESLTLHLLKRTSGNYSYRWHKLTWTNIKRVYQLHSFIYASLTIAWELLRKVLYPVLNFLKLGIWINPIERFPFRIMGNKINIKSVQEWWISFMI